MELLGYATTILIGLSLGLMGSGGSILTVPVLVYLFGMEPVSATSYSLFIVGVSGLVGTVRNYGKGYIDIRTSLLFGSVSVVVVFLVRKFLLPAVPIYIATIGNIIITRSAAIMILFAILMLPASVSMIRSGRKAEPAGTVPSGSYKPVLLAAYGIGIGLVTGFLGAGGGFLIVPALVLLVGLEMKVAVGTSLLIITLNSAAGFAGDIGQSDIDWPFLTTITVIAVAGIFAGSRLGEKIRGRILKQVFGWFVLVMGIYIITTELLINGQLRDPGHRNWRHTSSILHHH